MACRADFLVFMLLLLIQGISHVQDRDVFFLNIVSELYIFYIILVSLLHI